MDADCVCVVRGPRMRPVVIDRPLDLKRADLNGIRHDAARRRRYQDGDSGPWPARRDRRNGRRGRGVQEQHD